MMKESKIHLAVLSGVFATGGGVLAKFAKFYHMSNLLSAVTKVMLLGVMVTSNTIGCTMYVKALAGSSSSLPATVTSTTVHYLCSTLMATLIFGEKTSVRWWSGTTMVLLGLLLICYSPPSPGSSSQDKERKEEEEQEEQEEKELLRQRKRQ